MPFPSNHKLSLKELVLDDQFIQVSIYGGESDSTMVVNVLRPRFLCANILRLGLLMSIAAVGKVLCRPSRVW